MKSRFLPILFIIVCMAFMPRLVQAAQSPWSASDHMQARLIAAKDAEGDIHLALQIQLENGWHSYWRSPGEAGLPFTFNWEGTENAHNFTPSWPTPKRFREYGLKTFGYEGNIVFPIAFERQDPEKFSKLTLSLNSMVCKTICIPQSFVIQLNLPATEVTNANMPLIEFGQRKIPHKGDSETLKIESVVAGPKALIINAYSKQGFENADIFVELPDQALTGDVEIETDPKSSKQAMLKIPAPQDVKNLTQYLSGKHIIFTLTNGKEAIEKKMGL